MVTLLKSGSRGPEVVALQTRLNQKLRPSPNLKTDGIYGMKTEAAVRKFQTDCWLVVDGQAGQCTQAALFDREGYQPILHMMPFIPQPTSTSCWAAATAMMNNSNVPAVVSKTPSDLILPDGSLRNESETDDAVTNGNRFAAAHNLRMKPPMSWSLGLLQRQLQMGPLAFDMLWDPAGYGTPTGVPGQYLGSSGHFIVVIGMRGDNDQTGKGTTLRIHDPWPPNKGKIASVGYAKWMQEVPTRTYRVFHR